MRYLTSNAMGQLALEETIAWEQLRGMGADGDDAYAYKPPPKPTAPPPLIRQPVVKVDPYAGLRPRTPSSGVGAGSHGGTYPITEAPRVTKAPTPAYKQPEYKMPAQQPAAGKAAEKAVPKFDCAAWLTQKCAALARFVAAQGTVAQLQMAKASEGAVAMAQDNVATVQKGYEALKANTSAANCFQANPAQRLCPGEKADTAYMLPPAGGYPGLPGMAMQAVAASMLGPYSSAAQAERPKSPCEVLLARRCAALANIQTSERALTELRKARQAGSSSAQAGVQFALERAVFAHQVYQNILREALDKNCTNLCPTEVKNGYARPYQNDFALNSLRELLRGPKGFDCRAWYARKCELWNKMINARASVEKWEEVVVAGHPDAPKSLPSALEYRNWIENTYRDATYETGARNCEKMDPAREHCPGQQEYERKEKIESVASAKSLVKALDASPSAPPMLSPFSPLTPGQYATSSVAWEHIGALERLEAKVKQATVERDAASKLWFADSSSSAAVEKDYFKKKAALKKLDDQLRVMKRMGVAAPLNIVVEKALQSAQDNVVWQMDVMTDWRVLTRK